MFECPLTNVILCEITSFQNWINSQAISGEIGMDQTLDNISNSLYNGQLPSDWRKLAPATCMQLGAWMNHLLVSSICIRLNT